MSEVDEQQDLIGAIVAEARAEFGDDPHALEEAAGGKRRSRRTDTVTIFLDSVAGEQHGKVQEALDALNGAIAHATDLGDEENVARLQEQYDFAKAKADELKKELLNDAYTFELRALPPIIMKKIRRETRADLGIKEKGISADREEDYNELFPLNMILEQTVKFVDHSEGSEPVKLTPEKLREIYEWGDEFQWLRLTNLANDLQFRNTISTSVIESPDFSQGI